jgi:hypothetical protein
MLHLSNVTDNAYRADRKTTRRKEAVLVWLTASVVEGLESMISNPVTSLAWIRSPGDALVV